MKTWFAKWVVSLMIISGWVIFPNPGQCRDKEILSQAVMCTAIETFKPVDPAVVFSISRGEVFCFSRFDPVLEKTHIFHRWYKRDKLIFTMKLTLSPPKWSSFSRIQIRDADKGPWRVEILDDQDQLMQTLRFSMTD
ncbi:MAG: DUF2914 domain-containing protein [Desulfobacter sp.]|nr:DUF2914 domain-containing protein [Desulfobacter sp.]WDP84892.1 MAG: DUF2914 domain-containing protein [Desulfobacter sp.]